jgi:hypothetical protein
MADRRKLAAVASQDALGPPSSGEGAGSPKKRVNMLQRSLVLSLHHLEPGRSHRAIAEVVGISESSVARILAMHVTDVKQSTQALMQTGVLERLDDWAKAARLAAKKGYHQPAKDWLEAAGTIEPKAQPSTQVTVAPTVVLNMPFGLGALQPSQATAIEAHAVPVLPPKDAA